MKTIYGPMTSWRVGKCMNVDPICRTPKVCSFDCIYCMFGSLGFVAPERSDLVSAEAFSNELAALTPMEKGLTLRFTGAGEPTLAKNLGRMIEAAKGAGVRHTAVLTNSSLLDRTDVQDDLRKSEMVIAKIDAHDEETFKSINRPHPEISFSHMLRGLRSLRSGFQGSMRVQVMVMKENRGSMEELARICQDVGPDIVYVSTPTRPSHAMALSRRAVLEAAKSFEHQGCQVLVQGKG